MGVDNISNSDGVVGEHVIVAEDVVRERSLQPL